MTTTQLAEGAISVAGTTTATTIATAKHAAEVTLPAQELVELPGVGGVDLVTGDTPAAPQLSQAADGTYHLTLTWTKATKAHVGTAVAAVIGIGEIATQYVLPEGPYKVWAQSVVGAIGLVGIWLGVYLPTNKARKA